MAVLIKRFKVRCNGIHYGPGQPAGQILTGLPEEAETRLIAGSNGTIIKLELEPEPVGSERESNLDLTAEENPGQQHVEQLEEPEELRELEQQHLEDSEEMEQLGEPEGPEQQEDLAQSTLGESGNEAITADDILNTNLDDLIKPADETAEIPAIPQATSTKSRKRGGA